MAKPALVTGHQCGISVLLLQMLFREETITGCFLRLLVQLWLELNFINWIMSPAILLFCICKCRIIVQNDFLQSGPM